MLKKDYRLPLSKEKDFKNSFSTNLITIKTSINTLSHNRFATIISKKIDRRSVIRNKLRRMIDICIREESSNLRSGYDILFIVKKNFIRKADRDIRESVRACFEKLNLINYG